MRQLPSGEVVLSKAEAANYAVVMKDFETIKIEVVKIQKQAASLNAASLMPKFPKLVSAKSFIELGEVLGLDFKVLNEIINRHSNNA